MNGIQSENQVLKRENEELKLKVEQLEEKLKIYTDTTRQRRYYENHSEEVKERNKTYYERLKESNPEKLKEWRRAAYQKRKNKKEIIEENKDK